MNLDIAFYERGGPLHRFDVFDLRLDDRIVREVRAFELKAMTDWCRMQRQSDFFTRVKCHAGETG
jgi:hypothetical protein